MSGIETLETPDAALNGLHKATHSIPVLNVLGAALFPVRWGDWSGFEIKNLPPQQCAGGVVGGIHRADEEAPRSHHSVRTTVHGPVHGARLLGRAFLPVGQRDEPTHPTRVEGPLGTVRIADSSGVCGVHELFVHASPPADSPRSDITFNPLRCLGIRTRCGCRRLYQPPSTLRRGFPVCGDLRRTSER
jgi:hypothetical protein